MANNEATVISVIGLDMCLGDYANRYVYLTPKQ